MDKNAKKKTAKDIAELLRTLKKPAAADFFGQLPPGQICKARFIAESLRDLKINPSVRKLVLRKSGYEDEHDSILTTLRNEGLIP